MPENKAKMEMTVSQFRNGETNSVNDLVTVEEPMEIRLVYHSEEQSVMRPISVTMRTPGNDDELAVGFLFTEGILDRRDQIEAIQIKGVDGSGTPTNNIVRIDLTKETKVDLGQLQRNFLTNSSCGVCGKTSLESLNVRGIDAMEFVQLPDSSLVTCLPQLLRKEQTTFAQTGGIHAAGLFESDGKLIACREDVGRHNAVDKLIGAQFLASQYNLNSKILVVSGRASFELVQKAVVARISTMVAVGAPSSLAVEMARRYRLNLIGFTSDNRFNIYSSRNLV